MCVGEGYEWSGGVVVCVKDVKVWDGCVWESCEWCMWGRLCGASDVLT